MNWSQGFLRIWIVLAAIWILGCAIVGYAEWPKPRPAAYIFSKEDRIREVEYSDQDAVREAEERGLLAKKTTPEGDTLYWLAARTAMAEDTRMRLARDFKAWRHSEEIRQHLMAMAIALVAVPAFLLLSGLTIGWIIKGFRTR